MFIMTMPVLLKLMRFHYFHISECCGSAICDERGIEKTHGDWAELKVRDIDERRH